MTTEFSDKLERLKKRMGENNIMVENIPGKTDEKADASKNTTIETNDQSIQVFTIDLTKM